MKRVWIDTDIGTNPDDATALIFAVKHPQIELLGVSISGSSQEKRKEEALNLLSYLEADVPVYLGEELESRHLDNVEHTVAIGPLTNIARLILDDCFLGHLHIMGGVFSPLQYRGKEVNSDSNTAKDKEATRIVLSQYENITLSPLEVTAGLVLDGPQLEQVQNRNVLLKNRYDGYREHLETKFGAEHNQIVLHDILPICDLLGLPSIARKSSEFRIQADGTFLDSQLPSSQAVPMVQNPEGVPTPVVRCQVISEVDYKKAMSELLQFL